jgi:hypothetical protein
VFAFGSQLPSGFGVLFTVFTALRSGFGPRERHPIAPPGQDRGRGLVPARIRAQPAELVLDA